MNKQDFKLYRVDVDNLYGGKTDESINRLKYLFFVSGDSYKELYNKYHKSEYDLNCIENMHEIIFYITEQEYSIKLFTSKRFSNICVYESGLQNKEILDILNELVHEYEDNNEVHHKILAWMYEDFSEEDITASNVFNMVHEVKQFMNSMRYTENFECDKCDLRFAYESVCYEICSNPTSEMYECLNNSKWYEKSKNLRWVLKEKEQ